MGLSIEEDDEATYQLQSLKNYHGAKTFYSRNHQMHCVSINEYLKSWLDWSDLDQIQEMFWRLKEEDDSIWKPLEAAGIEICELRKEVLEMVKHSVQFNSPYIFMINFNLLTVSCCVLMLTIAYYFLGCWLSLLIFDYQKVI